MNNITLFSQIINKLSREDFRKIVGKYETDKHSKGINSWTHMVSMLYLHFSNSNSLDEISNGLRLSGGNLNHLGITKKVPKKSSLSYINKHRDWHLFCEFFRKTLFTIQSEQNFKREKFKFKIKRKIFALDSTLISLCLSLYDWAKYKSTKGAVKLHTLLDYDGCLPVYIHVTDGKVPDNKAAYFVKIPSGSVVVADRAYVDFNLLNKWDEAKINFVVRLKDNVQFIPYGERPLPENKDSNILKDEVILLFKEDTRAKYPEKLRRVAVYDSENDQTIEIITNNFNWTASTVADLYKRRWDIETFFKGLKSHLKIKSFVGTNENAVMVQIWTAFISYLILRYLKAIAKYGWSLSNLIAAIRACLFLKIDLRGFLDEPFKPPDELITDGRQEKLFQSKKK
ncbi:MAG: IS4 family transposase [Ignavibacteria bacterium]|nr:IS4 family transposase [Ignavibacteria bacterium]